MKISSVEKIKREYDIYTLKGTWARYEAVSALDALDKFYTNKEATAQKGVIRIIKVVASGELIEVLP